MGPTKSRSVISVANEQVSIASVCRHIGMYLPDAVDDTKSVKVFCPFSFLHADGGAEPAFRVYPGPNNAYCFACTQFFSPVSLAATAWDVDWSQAATQLLEWIGYKSLSLAEEYAKAKEPPEEPVDHAALALVLRMHCHRLDHEWLELEEGFPQRQLAKCLALLDKVTTQAEAARWLDRCREVMTAVIEGATDEG